MVVCVCVFEPTASSVIDGMPFSQVLINLSNTWRRLIKAFCCKIVLYSWGKSQQIHFPMKCLIEQVKTAGVMCARLLHTPAILIGRELYIFMYVLSEVCKVCLPRLFLSVQLAYPFLSIFIVQRV